jgi:hypothetical protein
MPYCRFDWYERVRAVENEYKSVRMAVDRLKSAVAQDPAVLRDELSPANLGVADRNLEGTDLVRLFAEFESALRSYDRARHHDPTRKTDASILIDSIGGRRGQGISDGVRRGAHAVRRVRNHRAHERDATPDPMPIAEARARLQTLLSWLPDEWD